MSGFFYFWSFSCQKVFMVPSIHEMNFLLLQIGWMGYQKIRLVITPWFQICTFDLGKNAPKICFTHKTILPFLSTLFSVKVKCKFLKSVRKDDSLRPIQRKFIHLLEWSKNTFWELKVKSGSNRSKIRKLFFQTDLRFSVFWIRMRRILMFFGL